MLPRDRLTVVCPRNDLESATILEIAERLGLHTCAVTGGWGLTLEEALTQYPDHTALREHVITIELPGTVAIGLLEAAGKLVHVVDHHGDGFAPLRLSSLEQFATLVGYTLTQAETEVAIADRDFLPGLSRAGVPCARARALREAEYALRGDTASVDRARQHLAAHARRLGDLTLVFAPESLGNCLLEAGQTPDDATYAKAADEHRAVDLPQVLAVLHADADPARLVGMRFSGRPEARGAIAAILADPDLRLNLDTWVGGGSLGCFCGAKARAGNPYAPLDALISRLLAVLLGTARPLRGYGCTFLLPLDLHQDADLGRDPARRVEGYRKILTDKVAAGSILHHRLALVPPGTLTQELQGERALESQARLYFLPLLRDQLFECAAAPDAPDPAGPGPCPIQRWRLPPEALAGLFWHLKPDASGTPDATVRIRDVSLYRYYNDLYLLAIQVEPATGPAGCAVQDLLGSTSDAWWRPLFTCTQDNFAEIARRQFDHWLTFTKHARILYPSFLEQVREGKFQTQVLSLNGTLIREFRAGDNVSPIVLYLLARFLARDPSQAAQTGQIEQMLRLQSLQEERMFVNVAYALAGPPPQDPGAHAEVERLFSLALYVDRGYDTWRDCDGYAYDPAYTRGLAAGHRLDRWRAKGTYLGFGPYANAYLGFDRFFAEVVAAEHVPYHYERMLIVALFYQLTLRNYNRRIAHATRLLVEDPGADPGRHFRDLRRGFIEFTNNYWFHELTLAIQGKEVFSRQVKALDIDPEYQEIKDEMERADEYVQSVRDRNTSDRMSAAGWIALVVAGFTIFLPAIEYEHGWQWALWGGGLLVVLVVVHRLLPEPMRPRLTRLRNWLARLAGRRRPDG